MFGRFDRNLETEMKKTNMKKVLKKYSEGRDFIFVDNCSINGACLSNSRLYLNKKGTSILTNNIRKLLYES